LQYHPLFWWAGLIKVREKYHIYIYQWNCRIIKEICIKYNITCSRHEIADKVLTWRLHPTTTQLVYLIWNFLHNNV
jgi:hypothetical protein